ncbi:ComEC/Rec2 family competence protein [Salipiger sp. IMCC34102]|uniref:ComEC/Rec2 family competence protein n=1 Tax=Salipiger sp. IMCC34102 TaxID=2510647 RepID=UPI0035137D23
MQEALLSQRGRLVLWLPVFLGLGIGGYYALSWEPGRATWAALGLCAPSLILLSRAMREAWRPLVWALAVCACGAGLAKLEVWRVEAPVLGFRYYGPIEGRVVGIDRSASDAVRLTLDRVRLDRLAPGRTPARVRVSLHGDQPLSRIKPAERLILTGHLTPPAGPAEPGGFDFRRHAWFEGIGAVGYTRTPVLRIAPADPGPGQWIFARRMAISDAIRDRLPGEIGGVAAAIVTGDRSGIDQPTLEALRASNLAHLLAISGLHMGLLTAFVFTGVRIAICAVPPVALRLPVKKVAAVAALIAGAIYLALSGGSVATQRAFIMVSVMLVAVLLDRRALTLRAIALAATIVLVLRPHALLGPGFQMSFAATTALVVIFGRLRGVRVGPRWMGPAVSVFISSLVAGLATAPFAAAHFNQISHYGLIANLASVPLMGTLVMPAAVLAACLAPVGLEEVGLWIMGQGLAWILFVARGVSSWDGALSYVPTPQTVVLPVLTLGLLWLILWAGRARSLGIPVAAVAFGLWAMTERPDVLIADTGGLIGVLTPEGRALSRATGNGFVARVWLENDGLPVPQAQAASRPGITQMDRGVLATLGGQQIRQVRGKTARDVLGDCGGATILVLTVPDEAERPCLVLDQTRLRQTGSVRLDLADDGSLRVRTASEVTGTRPWSGGSAVSGDRLPALPHAIQPFDRPQTNTRTANVEKPSGTQSVQ